MGLCCPHTLKHYSYRKSARRSIRACLLAPSLVLITAMLNACVSATPVQEPTGPTGIVLEGIVIRNELLYPVKDVMINVPATGAFAGCGNIMPRSECRTRFEAVDYAGNALVVSWKEYGKPHTTGEFDIDIPQHLDPGIPAWLEVIVFAKGQAGAKLIQ
jgi:hypothetical protein